MSTEVYIYDAVRTPRGRGKPGGSLHGLSPARLLADLMEGLRQRHGIPDERIEDVIIGCVTQTGEQGGCVARAATALAGWNQRVAALSINRYCASGLEAVNLAAAKVRAGQADLIVAGGVESMSRVAMGSDGGAWMNDPEVMQAMGFVPQGVSADLIATLEGFDRSALDHCALRSHQRAAAAQSAGAFARSILPVHDRDGNLLLARDEMVRPDCSLESLAALKPSFAALGAQGFDAVALERYPQAGSIQHLHHPGNASAIVDGAAAVLVGSAAAGQALGLQPRARLLASAVVGTEPTIMLTGPAPASRLALQRAGLAIDDIDLWEVNEAFAAVLLRFQRETGVAAERINVHGGAIALGHPLGATGAMLLGTLLDALQQRGGRHGVVSLCVGGGMGIASVIEALS